MSIHRRNLLERSFASYEATLPDYSQIRDENALNGATVSDSDCDDSEDYVGDTCLCKRRPFTRHYKRKGIRGLQLIMERVCPWRFLLNGCGSLGSWFNCTIGKCEETLRIKGNSLVQKIRRLKAKKIAERNFLSRKRSKRVNSILKRFPDIGKAVESLRC